MPNQNTSNNSIWILSWPNVTGLRRNILFLTDLPESFDSRKHWPHCRTIPVIQDQSSCLSCWAIASASVISDRMCTYNNLKENVQISASNLMNCCQNCSVSSGLCSPGLPLRAVEYWIDKGLVSGGEFGSYGTCDPYPIPPKCLQNVTSLKEKVYLKAEKTCKEKHVYQALFLDHLTSHFMF